MKPRLKKSISQEVMPCSDQGGWFIAYRNFLLGLLLLAATVFTYQPAWNAGFVWDDDKYVTDNPLLTAPDGLRRIWFTTDSPSQYFPLTYTVFRAEHALWGLNASGYHWVNILLHALNGLLLWRLLQRLSVPGAWWIAAIFALHPVQVESVAWITELKNILSLFFSLLTLFCWVRFNETGQKARGWIYLLALACYSLALFSKTTACTLPAAMLLIWWLKAEPIRWRQLAQLVPFVTLGVGMGLLTMWWERHHQGTDGTLFSFGLRERILIASHAAWFYVGKLFWPVNLTFSYPQWTINAADPAAYGWLAAGIGVVPAVYFVRRFFGRGVEVAGLFFIITLSPLLGFIMLYTFRFTFVADHYQYVASIGLIALAVAGFLKAFGALGFMGRRIAPLCFTGLLLVLAVLSWRQCRMYADAETLWRTTIERNLASWMARNNLGYALTQQGRLGEAMDQLRQALALKPDYAEAHNNLGKALAQNGRFEEAIGHLQQALAIRPDFAEAHNNLGSAWSKTGQPDAAEIHFQKALVIQPNFAEANYGLGNILLQKGDVDGAIIQFQKALLIAPDFSFAHNNLAVALLQKGRRADAVIHFQKALASQPDLVVAQNGLVAIVWQMATAPEPVFRDGVQALQLARQLEQITAGRNPAIVAALAAALAESGKYSEAIAAAERAVSLAVAQNDLAFVAELEVQLKSYRSGSPFRNSGPPR